MNNNNSITCQQLHQLDQLLVNLIEKKQPPDRLQALENRRKKSVKWNMEKKQVIKNDLFPCNFGEEKFAQFGPGVQLYFALLRYMAVLFFILFLNALPSILCCLKGKGLQIYHQNSISHLKVDMMKISLANLPSSGFHQTSFNNTESHQSISAQTIISQRQQIYANTFIHKFIIGLNDIYLSFIIMAFWIWWQIKSKEIIQNESKVIDLISARTLIVEGIFASKIQKEQKQTETERKFDNKKQGEIQSQRNSHVMMSQQQIWQLRIRRHFQKFAKVESVTVVYDYGQTLTQLMQFNRLVKIYENQQQSRQKKEYYYELLKIKFELIKKDYLQRTRYNMKLYNVPFLPQQAFVTFKAKEDRRRVKNLYKYQVNAQQLGFSLHPNQQNRYDSQLSDQQIPKIRKCHTEPVSIRWENYHRPKRQQLKATFCIGGFLFLILFMALVAVLLLSMKMAGLVDKNYHIKEQVNNNSQITEPIIEHPTYQEALHTHNSQTLYNFCSSLQISTITILSEYYSLCQEYFTNFTQHWITMLILSVLILLINLMLNYIIFALVQFRNHRTQTQKNRFLIGNIFVVYLVNMVGIILLIRAQFSGNASQYANKDNDGWSLVQLVRQIFPQFQAHSKIQTYPQLNRKWFIHIGNQLIFNYVISLIVCPWLYLLQYLIFDWLKFLLIKFKSYSKTQSILNSTLLCQQFDFQTFYAMLLTSYYFCMIFGTGMPVFYLLGGISFLSMYLSSWIIFYHVCKVPEPFDHSINEFITKILSFGHALHQFAVIMFLWVEDLFPEKQTLYINEQNSAMRKLKDGWLFLLMFLAVLIAGIWKKEIATMVKKRYFIEIKKKELNQEHIMKQMVEINDDQFHEQDYEDHNIENDEEMIEATLNKNRMEKQQKDEKYSHQSSGVKLIPAFTQHSIPFIQQKSYYRMQDNPLYTNIYYTLAVFDKIVYNNEYRASSMKKIQHFEEEYKQQIAEKK